MTAPTTAPTAAREYYPSYAIRAAGQLIANDGNISDKRLRHELARLSEVTGSVRLSDGSSNGSRVGRSIRHAVKYLTREGLIRRDGDRWLATDLPELACWVADALVAIDDRKRERAAGMSASRQPILRHTTKPTQPT